MLNLRYFYSVVAVFAAVGPSAHAAVPPGPVCGRPEVIGVVADDIVRRGVAAVIVPGGVGETPTVRPDTVRCAVRVQDTYYDTDRFGYVPQVRLSVLEFTVHAGHNGLFVDAISDPR